MQKIKLALYTLVAGTCIAQSAVAQVEPSEVVTSQEWHHQLLPAETLDEFYVRAYGDNTDSDGVFTLQDGVLNVMGTKKAVLVTNRSFANYRAVLEYRWLTDIPDRDSGVFVNAVDPTKDLTSIECNILGPSLGLTGAVQLIGPGKKQMVVGGVTKTQGGTPPRSTKSLEHPVGEWNTIEILCVDGHFQVKVNSQLAFRGSSPQPLAGQIFLQSLRGEIEFRRFDIVDYDELMAMAMELASNGEWEQAGEEFAAAFEREPECRTPLRGLWLATLYAAIGNVDAHAKLSRELFEKYAEPDRPSDASRPSKAYTVFPGASNPDLLQRARAGAYHAAFTNPDFQWALMARGMAEYRLGDHEQALQWLQKPARNGAALMRAPALAFSAMATHGQGNKRRAERLLQQAQEAFSQIERPSESEFDTRWNDILGAQLAIDEAKELLNK